MPSCPSWSPGNEYKCLGDKDHPPFPGGKHLAVRPRWSESNPGHKIYWNDDRAGPETYRLPVELKVAKEILPTNTLLELMTGEFDDA
jgi:hypothetical protein